MNADRLKLYRPTLVSILIFSGEPDGNGGGRRTEPPSAKDLTRRFKELPAFPKNFNIFREKDMVIYNHTSTPFSPADPDEGPECTLTMDELVKAVRDAQKETDHLSRVISKRVDRLRPLGRFTVIAAGSERNYWFQTKIDMSQMLVSGGRDEKTLKDLSSRSKIDLLTTRLAGSKNYLGDVLTGIRGDPRLLGFKPPAAGSRPALPSVYLLDIPQDKGGELSLAPEIDEKMYVSVVDGISGGFARMLAYQCVLQDNFTEVYPHERESAEDIRDAIRNLQAAINALLRGELADGDIPTLHGTSSKAYGESQEEKLLNLASMYFSQVTEFDSALESNKYGTQDSMGNLEHQAEVLGMEKIASSELEGETVLSLKEEMNRFAKDVFNSYQNLKESVNNSQNTLRNTVEVLKTSLENKQRTINESREWIWNFLIVIIACFGLMDAITNFMIYYLEYGDAVTAIQYFFYSMLPVIAVLVVIASYMRYVEKRNR